MQRLLLPCLLIFAFLFGCATTKKTPCEPYSKTIDCFSFEHQECKDKVNKFLGDLVQGYGQTRKTSDHLTVNIENSVLENIYNLKARLDVDIPTMYIDVTHCMEGEVAEKKRIYIDLSYR